MLKRHQFSPTNSSKPVVSPVLKVYKKVLIVNRLIYYGPALIGKYLLITSYSNLFINIHLQLQIYISICYVLQDVFNKKQRNLNQVSKLIMSQYKVILFCSWYSPWIILGMAGLTASLLLLLKRLAQQVNACPTGEMLVQQGKCSSNRGNTRPTGEILVQQKKCSFNSGNTCSTGEMLV